MAARSSRPMFMAIDFGTSHIRAAIGPAYGRPLSIAREPVSYKTPADGPDTAVEFDPDSTWKLVGRVARKALSESGVARSQIRSVAVTSQRLGLVMYGQNTRELYSGPNRDMRAVFQGGQIDASAGNMLWQMTGHGPGMLSAWSKILWLKEERPEQYENLRTVSGLADWLAYRMTGILLMESSLACDSGLALVATGAPATGLAPHAGVSEVDLPQTCASGTIVGKLVTASARTLGLDPGTPVVAAGSDSQVGLIGLGVSEPETSGVIAGWSAAVLRVKPLPSFDDTHAMWTGRHVLSDRWVMEANAGEMGGAYDWLLSITGDEKDREALLRRIDRQAAAIEPGANGAAAYLGPSFVHMSNVSLRTGGLIFPVPLSFEPPGRATLARAALENFAFAIRYNADRLAMLNGPSHSFAAGGGLTKSKTFRDVLAAAMGDEIGFSRSGETTVLGALSIAASGVDEGEIDELAQRRRRELSVVSADAGLRGEYDDLYHAWRERERRLADVEL